MKTGDTAFIHADEIHLSRVGLKAYKDSKVNLLSRLNTAEIRAKEELNGQKAWWVHIHHPDANQAHEYWVPEAWLTPLNKQTQNGDKYYSTNEVATRKEQNSMNPVNITITKVPSTLAQQGGAKEEVIAQGTELSDTNSGAAVIVAAKNAEAILSAITSASIKVYCVSAGNQC